MSVHITCPDCDARLKLPQAPAPGALLICPKCSKSIRVAEAELDEDEGAERNAKSTPDRGRDDGAVSDDRKSTRLTDKPRRSTPARPSRDRDDLDEDEEPRERRRSKGNRGKSSRTSPVIWVILAIVVVAAVGGLTAYAVVQLTFTTPPQQTIVIPTGAGRIGLAPDLARNRQSDDELEQRQRQAFEEQRKRALQKQKDAEADARQFTPPPRLPRSLDWAGLNIADVSVGQLAARPATELEALRYMPPQSEMVVGLDAAALGSKLVLTWLMQKLGTLGEVSPIDQMRRETGLGLKDLDHIVVAGRINYGHDSWAADKPFPMEVTAYAVKTKTTFNRDTILQVVKAGHGKQAFGKEFYPIPDARGDKPVYAYLPSDSVIVICMLPEEQLGDVLKLGGQLQSLRTDMLDALGALDRCHAWIVAPPAPILAHLPMEQPLAVSLKPMTEAVSRSQVAGISMRFQDELLNWGMCFAFANDADAKQSLSSINRYWGKPSSTAIGEVSTKLPNGFDGVLGELARETRWQQRGPCVVASAPVHFRSLDAMLKSLK
jgi:hypothetical protein